MAKASGWMQLVQGWPWFQGKDRFPLPAYSEYLPPPYQVRKPYGWTDTLFRKDDPHGWPVSEYEEALELRPGLEKLGKQLVGIIDHLAAGRPLHGISRGKLTGNRFWPAILAEHAGKLPHERCVVLSPLALSRTQDDKGRVRWTLFGNSEQGPAKAFWRGFWTAPDKEVPEQQGLDFFRRLLHAAYGEPLEKLADLRAAGLRILPGDDDPDFSWWREGPLPSWTEPLLWNGDQDVRYLLTFRPLDHLPGSVQAAYLAGKVHLLPSPGSLVPWGVQGYRKLQSQLPLCIQVPLLHVVGRHEGPYGLRIPQSGWLHEIGPAPASADYHGPVRNTFKRTHRFAKVHRYEDELALTEHEDHMTHVLLSNDAEELGLYGKPMGLNSQIWTEEYKVLLDGPRAGRAEIERAKEHTWEGGLFGYRLQYPAMRVGKHEVYWQRPLVAFKHPRTGEGVLLPGAPLGYLTAYHADKPDLANPIEMWPRLLRREPHLAAVEIFDPHYTPFPHQACMNVRKLLEAGRLLGGRPLPRSLAHALLTTNKVETLDGWLDGLPAKTTDAERAGRLTDALRASLEPASAPLPEALTYDRTARRSFEVSYWNTIKYLSNGNYLNRNNADCIDDEVTRRELPHPGRDLDALADYLLAHYRKLVAKAGLKGKALVGDIPFKWQTDFRYPWMSGWLNNEKDIAQERNLIVVIPGKDRGRAVIMADHYDTAYMADRHDKEYGGNGARLAANGADDNGSATAALMLAAPVFLEMSRARKLACDIWLVHLTGEEFPADCLGARHLTQALVEGSLAMRLESGKTRDLSATRVQGVYVLDMIAHNKDRDLDTFQMAPGSGPESMWLAWQSHLATEIWNTGTERWNARAARRGCRRGRRIKEAGDPIPAVAKHMKLYGEVRPPYDLHSTLFNTDGQIFSDGGVPVVLFMENYDINRSGYHDMKDTMELIDLDYGAAVAAIAIESVARAATEDPPDLM